MKIKTKSLLIHNGTKNNKTTAVVVNKEDFTEKTQEFLRRITKNNLSQGLILRSEESNANYAVVYEKENFIIVSKKGSTKSARLYGNWNEALNFARKIITKGQYEPRIVLAEYAFKN